MDMYYVNKLKESVSAAFRYACHDHDWPEETFTFYVEENGAPLVDSNADDIDHLESSAEQALEALEYGDFVVDNRQDLDLQRDIWQHLEATVDVEQGKFKSVRVDVRTTPEELMVHLVDKHGLQEAEVIDLT